jgi:hypothetical protein
MRTHVAATVQTDRPSAACEPTSVRSSHVSGVVGRVKNKISDSASLVTRNIYVLITHGSDAPRDSKIKL